MSEYTVTSKAFDCSVDVVTYTDCCEAISAIQDMRRDAFIESITYTGDPFAAFNRSNAEDM